MQFASDVETMTCYQVLRLTRLCTPLKECDGQQSIMISKKNSPTIRGLRFYVKQQISNFSQIQKSPNHPRGGGQENCGLFPLFGTFFISIGPLTNKQASK